MKLLEEKILKEGKVIDNKIIKVDNFVNHLIDTKIINAFAEEVKKYYSNQRVDKILTVEASGIAIACAVAEAFDGLPFVFARKNKSAIIDDNVYKVEVKSFTQNRVSTITVAKPFLKKGENILIVDDFLAEGNAAIGLIEMCEQAGANVVGVAVVIEKEFQGGKKRISEKGVKVFAGASIKEFKDNKPVFYSVIILLQT